MRLAVIRQLPENVAFSSTARRGAAMSPRKVAPAARVHFSEAVTFPWIVPFTVMDPTLMSPVMRACSPTVSVPVEVTSPLISPSIRSSVRN